MLRSKKTIIKRRSARAIYDKDEIYKIIDNNSICHIGFIHEDYPVVIPTSYGRIGNYLYIHGAPISRMMKILENGVNISVSIAKETALVLARSTTHHSINYESVVVFGKGKLVAEENKKTALKSILDNMLEGRWEEVREPTEKELKVTQVIAISLDEATGKRRDEGVLDAKEDMNANVWAGIIPKLETFGKPIPDKHLLDSIDLPNSIKNIYK